MAEIVAVVASVGTLAEYGFKLSLQLFTYSQAVATAGRSLRDMSNEVLLTSAVLQKLSSILKSDGQIASTTAMDATYKITRECDGVFRELGMILEPSLARLGDGGSVRVSRALEKLKWPLKQSKLDVLKARLDRSKATLTLMLQVLGYAKDVANQDVTVSSLAFQQHIIGCLAHMERRMGEKVSPMQDMTASDIESPMQYPHVTTEASTVFSSASVASAEAIEKT
ncbi:putative Fungal N-terminal domain-containing protein [Seiridium cardinale]